MLLVDHIGSTLGSLSQAEQRFAHYVLEHEDIIYKSITEVIDESGAGYGTVIRLCKKLGCSGFQDFKIRLAYESSLVAQGNRKTDGNDLGSRLADEYIEQIVTTARNLEAEKMEQITAAITRARKILIVGVAGSYPTALELAYRLTRFGFQVSSEADEHMQAIRASCLGAGDLLIVISFSGSTKSILDTAGLARKAGATVVAITNYLRSPLVKLADYYLLTVLRQQALEAEIGSRIPFYFIVEVLTKQILSHLPRAAEALKTTSDSVSDKQI